MCQRFPIINNCSAIHLMTWATFYSHDAAKHCRTLGSIKHDQGALDTPAVNSPHSADTLTPHFVDPHCSQHLEQEPIVQKRSDSASYNAATLRKLQILLRVIYHTAQLSLYLLTLPIVFGKFPLPISPTPIQSLFLWLLLYTPLHAFLALVASFLQTTLKYSVDLDSHSSPHHPTTRVNH